MEQFERISEISGYNTNYYVGFDGDLLYGESDDDNETEWFLVRNKNFQLIGYSYTSNHEKLVITDEMRT